MRYQKAFTLIEILLVITMIGILVSIVIVNVNSARDKAQIARVVQFSDSVYRAMGSDALAVWNFDEGGTSTVVKDGTNTGKDGVLGNGNCQPGNGTCPSWVESFTFSGGNFGKALSFDGNNDYVNITPNLGNLTAMTIEFWFYVMQTDKNRNQYLIYANAGGATGGNWWLRQSFNPNGTGNINFNDLAKINPSDWTAGEWNHLLVSVDSSKSQIYVNGELKATGLGLSPIKIGANMHIGHTSNRFRGTMDRVIIYSRTLSGFEIKQHYAEGLLKYKLTNI